MDVQKDCAKDTIALGTSIGAFDFDLAKGSVTKTSTWAYKFEGCAKTCSYTESSSVSDTIVTGIASATGTLTINSSNPLFHDVDITVVVICIMTESQASATDTFVITGNDLCRSDNTVVNPSFTSTTHTWNLWQVQNMPFSAMTTTRGSEECGVIVYTLFEDNLPSTGVLAISETGGSYKVTGTASDDQNWVGTYTFKVTAKQGIYDDFDS